MERRDTAAPAQVRSDSGSSATGTVEEMKQNARDGIESKYFAAARPDLITNALEEKIDDWMQYVAGTGHFRKIAKSYHMYYGQARFAGGNSSEIVHAGPKGQFSLVFINELRNTVKHVYNMITQQKIVFDCHGSNTDVDTTESCILGRAILENVMREKNVAQYLKRGCEYACFLSEGHIALGWDHWAGTAYTVDEVGQPVFDGDITIQYYAPWNVIKDHWRRDEKLPWVILIDWVNKYDLAAKYPEKADAIFAVDPESLWKYQEQFYNQNKSADTDLVPLMTFYHERSPAIPNGRLVRFLDTNTKLFDGDLPYMNVPVYRIAPDHLAETPHGYTFAFDLLSVQDLQNLIDSIVATTMKTYGVGVVKLPEGHNMRHQAIAEGLQALVINETNGRAEAMNFASLPQGIFDFRQWLTSRQEVIAGINSVIKGQPDANIGSGNFAALIAAQAYQFSGQLQESYQMACQAVGQGIIEMYQAFANTPRVVKMVGKNKEYMLKSFRKEDLQGISTVTVDIGSAAAQTTAMRMELAEKLVAGGYIKSADELIQVYKTGQLDQVTERDETELNNIDRENEELRKGGKPIVLATDNVLRHVHKHLQLLDDPRVRSEEPEVVENTLGHIQEHLDAWTNMTINNPMLLQLVGLPPAQSAMMPQGPGLPAPQGGNEMQAEGLDPSLSPNPTLPQPPDNPMTGQPLPLDAQPIEPPPTALPS